MQSYLERYMEGEQMGVWTELVALGSAVRNEAVFPDAQAVAQEMMRRAKHNIALLTRRLADLEYRFIDPDQVWTPPDERIADRFNALEQRYGPFPLVIRKWYEVVGEVDFMGTHPKLSHHDGLNWGGSEQLGCYSDPMRINWLAYPGDTLLSYYLNRADGWDEMARMEEEMPPPYGADIGLSAINKANHSGSGAIQILVPSAAFDTLLIDWDNCWMGTFFVSYLRACFQWGGFPGLRMLEDSVRPQEELGFLTEDLLPI